MSTPLAHIYNAARIELSFYAWKIVQVLKAYPAEADHLTHLRFCNGIVRELVSRWYNSGA